MSPTTASTSESPLTPAEWTVMDAVWRRSPATVREVVDELGDSVDWAYTTVKTMMDRLVGKGVLRSDLVGRVRVYRPALSREAARRAATRSFLDRAFGGAVAPLVHHLLDLSALDPGERDRLERILTDELGGEAPEDPP